MRELYAHLLSQRVPGQGRVVDKSLNASRYMGVLASIFPDAPIVWLRRDPLDCAWSAYRTWFLRGLAWSYSLTDIAAHFRNEDTLFSHWIEILGLQQVLIVNYEDLVTDPAATIARIVDHCGLSLEPAMLNSHDDP